MQDLDEILGVGTYREEILNRRDYWVKQGGQPNRCFGRYILEVTKWTSLPVCFTDPYKNDLCCEECMLRTEKYREMNTDGE